VTDLLYQSNPWILPAVMLVVLGLAIELPYRLRAAVSLKNPNLDPVNALQAGLLTLAAFVLGLSFSQASARFDGRRAIVIAEANAIGTAWLRADQLEPAESRRFRQILTDAIYNRNRDDARLRSAQDWVRIGQPDANDRTTARNAKRTLTPRGRNA
jgi:hypothetical protein